MPMAFRFDNPVFLHVTNPAQAKPHPGLGGVRATEDDRRPGRESASPCHLKGQIFAYIDPPIADERTVI
jgi:hypothetical protein